MSSKRADPGIATYEYDPRVLETLATHGIQPTAETAPPTIRAFLNDLYCYELRALRARALRGEIPKAGYAGHVTLLRKKYWLLSLPLHQWATAYPESATP